MQPMPSPMRDCPRAGAPATPSPPLEERVGERRPSVRPSPGSIAVEGLGEAEGLLLSPLLRLQSAAIFDRATISFPAIFPSSTSAAPAKTHTPLETPKRAPASGTSIYIVDDEEGLTELYTLFLEGTGYSVRAFTHRSEALTALASDESKPDLLILDYMGHPPPVGQFMTQCRASQPAIRFLMASGLYEFEIQFNSTRPDHFLQKPFTAEEFLRAVNAVLNS